MRKLKKADRLNELPSVTEPVSGKTPDLTRSVSRYTVDQARLTIHS